MSPCGGRAARGVRHDTTVPNAAGPPPRHPSSPIRRHPCARGAVPALRARIPHANSRINRKQINRRPVIPSGAHRTAPAATTAPGGLPRNLPAPSDRPAPPPPPACARPAPRSVRFRGKSRPAGWPASARDASDRAEQRWAHAARRGLSQPRPRWRTTGLDSSAAGFLGGPAGIFAAAEIAHRAPLGMTPSLAPKPKREAPRCSTSPGTGEVARVVHGQFRGRPRGRGRGSRGHAPGPVFRPTRRVKSHVRRGARVLRWCPFPGVPGARRLRGPDLPRILARILVDLPPVPRENTTSPPCFLAPALRRLPNDAAPRTLSLQEGAPWPPTLKYSSPTKPGVPASG